MPIVTLDFPFLLNVSVQIGDVVYWAVTSTDPPGTPLARDWAEGPTPHWQAGFNDIVRIGTIVNIPFNTANGSRIEADMPNVTISEYGLPPVDAFIMFSKDNKVNLSSILGYYASVKVVNNSTDEGEIFSIASDVVESSK
tara:strand:- start:2195 stop:2614 length:420 start_codon:yes stop_codon:yes gene_type:complete